MLLFHGCCHYIEASLLICKANFPIWFLDSKTSNLKVHGCPSKENLFGQSALLMNATYIVFSLR